MRAHSRKSPVLKFVIMIVLAGLLMRTDSLPADQARYYYDDLGRLTAVADSTGALALYSYDAVGNLTGIQRFTPPGSGLGVYLVVPSTGVSGTSVTIQGYGFDPTPANNTVQFNGTAATVTSASATTLLVTVPAGATTGPVTVTTSQGTAVSSQAFTFTPPTITALSSDRLPQGVTWPVTVTGTNLQQATAMTFTQAGLTGRIQAGATATTLPVHLTVASTVPPGLYAFSITSANGVVQSGSVAVTVTAPITQTVFGPAVSVAIPNVAVPAIVAPSGSTMSVGSPVSVQKP